MKYVLLLLLLFASVKDFACTYIITQNNWRWRNNDGNETSATWKAAQTTPATYNTNQGVVRLRVEVINNYRTQNSFTGQCSNSAYSLRDSLQYTTDTTNNNSWVSIDNDPSKAFVLAGTNAYVAQNASTTPQIIGTSNTFSTGIVMVSARATNFTISALARTEVEWAISGTANMLSNANYYFRQFYRVGSFYRRYTSYPSLTTAPPLPVNLTFFTVKAEGNKTRLKWATATEQNNDRFEVQRSPDQRTWQTITTIKGKGNTNATTEYTAYDEKPISGINYYRLQQFDKDGKSTLSETRLLKTTGSGVAISVWPNPVKDVISFSLGNTGTAKLEATLSDPSGRITYRQTFTNIAANSVNEISLQQKPAPGVYLLQLKGDGLSVNTKVVVQ